MKTKKRLLAGLTPGTEAYVLAHWEWRRKRGKKNPSEIIRKIKVRSEQEPYEPVPETSEWVKRHNEYMEWNRKWIDIYTNITNPHRSLQIALRHQKQYLQNPEKATDKEYEEHIISSVESYRGSEYAISGDIGSLFITSSTIKPEVGHVARFYGRGFGSVVRGVDIEGYQIRYQSPRQLELQYQKNQIKNRIEEAQKQKNFDSTELDKRFDLLPKVYQQRISNFRRNKPSFRWKHESSEIHMLEQSLLLAKFFHQKTSFFGKYVLFGQVNPELLGSYREEVKSTYDIYKDHHDGQLSKIIEGFDDGHSGNSLGFVFRMTFLYLTNPEATIHQHGWLAPLCGCKGYGCHRSLAKKEKQQLVTLVA